MKSVLITFDQAYYERIIALLDRLGCRGFTYLERVQGRGSKTGDPHFGSHAWPSMRCIGWTCRQNSSVCGLLSLTWSEAFNPLPTQITSEENLHEFHADSPLFLWVLSIFATSY